MGDVKETLADRTPIQQAGKNPKVFLEEAKEHLYDLLTLKHRDLRTEGASSETENRQKITVLETAIEQVNRALAALDAYG